MAKPVRELVRESKAYLCISGESLALAEALKRKIDPKRIRVLAALPETDLDIRATFTELRSSYDDDLMKRSIQQMKDAREHWPESSFLSAKPDESIRDQVVAASKSCRPDELIIIFAHNENGILRFPDGSLLDSQWLGRFNARSPMPVVLSCETLLAAPDAAGVKTLKRLDFKDTGIVISETLKRFQGKQDLQELGHIVRSLDEGFRGLEKARDTRLKVVLGISATGGITLFVAALPDAEPETNNRNKEENGSTGIQD